MCDSDEDVVLVGSALHQHLVSSGYMDMEVQEKEKDKGTSIAAELDGVNGVCGENGNEQPVNSMKK